jgi:hypothetical protein
MSVKMAQKWLAYYANLTDKGVVLSEDRMEMLSGGNVYGGGPVRVVVAETGRPVEIDERCVPVIAPMLREYAVSDALVCEDYWVWRDEAAKLCRLVSLACPMGEPAYAASRDLYLCDNDEIRVCRRLEPGEEILVPKDTVTRCSPGFIVRKRAPPLHEEASDA